MSSRPFAAPSNRQLPPGPATDRRSPAAPARRGAPRPRWAARPGTPSVNRPIFSGPASLRSAPRPVARASSQWTRWRTAAGRASTSFLFVHGDPHEQARPRRDRHREPIGAILVRAWQSTRPAITNDMFRLASLGLIAARMMASIRSITCVAVNPHGLIEDEKCHGVHHGLSPDPLTLTLNLDLTQWPLVVARDGEKDCWKTQLPRRVVDFDILVGAPTGPDSLSRPAKRRCRSRKRWPRSSTRRGARLAHGDRRHREQLARMIESTPLGADDTAHAIAARSSLSRNSTSP